MSTFRPLPFALRQNNVLHLVLHSHPRILRRLSCLSRSRNLDEMSNLSHFDFTHFPFQANANDNIWHVDKSADSNSVLAQRHRPRAAQSNPKGKRRCRNRVGTLLGRLRKIHCGKVHHRPFPRHSTRPSGKSRGTSSFHNRCAGRKIADSVRETQKIFGVNSTIAHAINTWKLVLSQLSKINCPATQSVGCAEHICNPTGLRVRFRRVTGVNADGSIVRCDRSKFTFANIRFRWGCSSRLDVDNLLR